MEELETQREDLETALRELQERAAKLGANAVIGVALGYENISLRDGSGMLMVCASGTAVTATH